jgi:hypothetical protein
MYLCAVPAFDTHVSSNAGEASNGTLVLPAVFGHQTVGTIWARNRGKRAASIIVASVIWDCGRRLAYKHDASDSIDLPEMADERLAQPRAIAETVVVNFMMRELFGEAKMLVCRIGLEVGLSMCDWCEAAVDDVLYRNDRRSYTYRTFRKKQPCPRWMLVTLIIVIVITQAYMGKMRNTQRVSMVVNSVAVRLAQLVRAGDGVQAVLGTKIGRWAHSVRNTREDAEAEVILGGILAG